MCGINNRVASCVDARTDRLTDCLTDCWLSVEQRLSLTLAHIKLVLCVTTRTRQVTHLLQYWALIPREQVSRSILVTSSTTLARISRGKCCRGISALSDEHRRSSPPRQSATTLGQCDESAGCVDASVELWVRRQTMSAPVDVELYAIVCMLSLFAVLGTVGNLVVLYVFSRPARRDRASSGVAGAICPPASATVYIMALAAADLVTCTLDIPSTVYMECVVFRTRLDIFCKFYQVRVDLSHVYSYTNRDTLLTTYSILFSVQWLEGEQGHSRVYRVGQKVGPLRLKVHIFCLGQSSFVMLVLLNNELSFIRCHHFILYS